MTSYYTAANRHTAAVSLDPANKQRDDSSPTSYCRGISAANKQRDDSSPTSYRRGISAAST
ncbi:MULTISPECIES: hypothetical protein [unclassified Wolbachia]|uniref:hypothetical protein n=1 Tax=unclassified Wolbachia TaxID=2640676 RepID=UPI002230EC84|nr:hypothetical protein [Wolbachia endosymbiont (group A) of Apoderus coryli]